LHQHFPGFPLSFDSEKQCQVPRRVQQSSLLSESPFHAATQHYYFAHAYRGHPFAVDVLCFKIHKPGSRFAVRVVLRNVGIVISMIFAHLLEAGLFAAFYFVIDAFKDWNTSFYFSLVSYATVGYGDVTLPQHWRLIGGLEGLVGALMVGWSVAVLVAVLQRLRGMST
jgi:hypothetical protein